MKGIKFSISISAFLILLLAGCAPKNNYYKDDVISDNKNNKVTLGTVQKGNHQVNPILKSKQV